MSDEITIASTTDSEEDIARALGQEPKKKEPEKTSEAPKEEAESVGSAEESQEEVSEESPEGSEEPAEKTKGEEKAEKAEEAKPKAKKRRFEKRIDQLTRDKYELQARLDEAERKLTARLTEPEVKTTKNEDGKPRVEDFETYEAYIEALTDWKYETRRKKEKEELDLYHAERRMHELHQSWNKKIESARSKHEDWDEIAESDILISSAMEGAIMDSDFGAEIVYFLGKNPSEAERISKLSPLAAIREIGKIEDALSKQKAPSDQAKKEPKVSKAPAPIKPIKGKAAASAKSLDEMSYQDYRAAREAQIREREGRR